MANLSNINNKFLVTTGGNVAIGTTSPLANLHIASSSPTLRLQDTDGGYTEFAANSTDLVIKVDPDDVVGSSTIQFEIDGSEYMRIATNGNVGIGTVSPAVSLDVNAGTSDTIARFESTDNRGRIQIDDNDTTVYAIAEGSKMSLGTSNTLSSTNLTIDSSGQVGIGTTSPDTKLHVEGSMLVDAFNAGSETGIFFREGFTSSNKYNQSILAYDHNGSAPDGISINAYDGISFCTGSNSRQERMRIDSSGNVGIDTTSPQVPLQIGTHLTTAPSDTGLCVSNRKSIRINDSDGSYNFGVYIKQNYSGTSYLILGTRHNGTDTDGLVVKNGQVGIGTSSPGRGLTIDRSNEFAALEIIKNNSGNQIIYLGTGSGSAGENPLLQLKHNNVETVRIYSDGDSWFTGGDVGIGTTSPNTKLNIGTSGIIRVNSDSANPSNFLEYYYNASYNHGLAVEGDRGLRIFSQTGDSNAKLTFYTEGQERMRITSGGDINCNGRIKVEGSNTDQYYFEGTRSGVGVTYRLYDNSNNVYHDSWTSQVFRLNQNGGSGGNLIITGGNVGINDTNPLATSSIISNNSTYPTQTIVNASGGGDGFVFQRWQYVSGTTAYICDLKQKVTSGVVRYAFDVTNNSVSYPNNLVLDRGNVGIGETSPDSKLHVKGDFITIEDPSGGFKMELSADTDPVTIMSDNLTGAAYGQIAFVAGNGSGSNDQERMRINSSGNVGIGLTVVTDKLDVTTSASQYTGSFIYGGTNGSYGALRCTLSASNNPSFIDFYRASYSTTTPVGAIVTGGSNVLYQSYSDYRLKENVADLTGALDRVKNLQPKTFNYINAPETTNEGFIAHELQEVVPQAVSGEKDGINQDGTPKYQGVDNAHIVPLLVGAIKELEARVKELENK